MSKQAFTAFKDALIDALNNNADWQASKASGSADAYIKSAQSSVITDDLFVQYGLPYTPFIDAGRPKNKTNSGGLVQGIYDWLQYKKYDFDYENDKERLGIAIAISTNIAKEGSYKFRNNMQTDVFGQVIDEALPTLYKALEDESRASFTSEVQKEIKRINEITR